VLTGKYEDDFEDLGSDDDDEYGSSDTDGVGESVGSSTSPLNTPRRQKVSYLKRMAIANRDNTLTLTLRDVHVSMQIISFTPLFVCIHMDVAQS
jgi:hypothetical protein